MKIVLIDKATMKETTFADNLTEQEAESICESWGWNYCDEKGQSYWMSIEEEQ